MGWEIWVNKDTRAEACIYFPCRHRSRSDVQKECLCCEKFMTVICKEFITIVMVVNKNKAKDSGAYGKTQDRAATASSRDAASLTLMTSVPLRIRPTRPAMTPPGPSSRKRVMPTWSIRYSMLPVQRTEPMT